MQEGDSRVCASDLPAEDGVCARETDRRRDTEKDRGTGRGGQEESALGDRAGSRRLESSPSETVKPPAPSALASRRQEACSASVFHEHVLCARFP